MRVLILANGDPPSPKLARRCAAEHDLLLATDGAAHRAAELGLSPDIICGDFDSVRLDVAQREFPLAEFLPTPDQEQADLEKAILVACERGATAITILGASGDRMDHTLANFALLLRYHTEIPLCLRDDLTTTRAVSGTEEQAGELVLVAEPGDTISLVSFTGTAHVSALGVQWPLDAELLAIGTRGVSNIALSDRVTIRVQGGAILVFHLQTAHHPDV
ncbi:MAG TPA: thiamine diphosphokinase [Chthonomonadaceae bacterium]|nr:thiamine diphosphokinase [Chthonomonadaceae bacterium]